MEYTDKDIMELKKLHAKAVKDKEDTFFYMEATLLTKYAGYLIEYLESK